MNSTGIEIAGRQFKLTSKEEFHDRNTNEFVVVLEPIFYDENRKEYVVTTVYYKRAFAWYHACRIGLGGEVLLSNAIKGDLLITD